MRLTILLLLSIGVAAALPAMAEQATDTPAVAVLRGSSAPPVVVQTVVQPEIVYVPVYYPGYSYYPAYSFYPAYFVQPQRLIRHPFPATGMMRGHK